ncbi:hypothetical protein DFS33DRAFT_90425 [Desarmillaria ectypa]|nr:hypothetical protein DFS33DRAFT_90425 [Desarmillaria ectypa]
MAGSSASSTKPPRPPNAWILFRSDMVRVMPKPANGASQQSVVSKAISKLWAEADPAIKHEYERRAEIRKQEHAEMYPDYRFQPVKKEDKERRKEEAKQAKERSRRSGRKDRGSNRYEPYPTASTSTVTTGPFPYAIPHFYPLTTQSYHHGPLGPTPPMSAAPSPSPENSPLEVVSDDQDIAHLQTYETMNNVSSVPSSAMTSGIVPSMLLRSSNDAPRELSLPSSQASAPQLPPSPPPAPLQSSGYSFSWSLHEQPIAPQSMSLSVSMPSDDRWNDPTFDDSLQALLTSTDDPSIFTLSHFGEFPDHATLDAVALPMYDPNAFNFDLGNIASQPNENSVPSNEGMLSSLDCSHSTQCNLEDFINFDPYEPSSPQNLPPSPPPVELPVKQPYQPPSGAALSASRRVAGSWKHPFVRGSSPDITPLPYGVSAN